MDAERVKQHTNAHQFHFNPLSCCRFTFPPLSTHTTLELRGTLTSPFNTAATDAAAAPSTTSLQCDMIHMSASNISESGSATTSSTNCRTASWSSKAQPRHRSPLY